MARIILIETAASLCSVALSEDGRITAEREAGGRSHASLTAPFIKEVLESRGLRVKDCNAVCVSAGPGSYTGLRVGVSTAKGLCFGSSLPLVSAGTLDSLVAGALSKGLVPEGCSRIVPLLDARRMEVYTATFSAEGERLTGTSPVVVDGGSFREELSSGGTVLFIGDGAAKCSSVITDEKALFVPTVPRAADMAPLAEKAFNEKRFEDTAYFEPFYLKDFIATVSRKKLF